MEDSEGAKYKFDIEGNVTREKVLKLFELMDIMNLEDEQKPQNWRLWVVKFGILLKTTSQQANSPLQQS